MTVVAAKLALQLPVVRLDLLELLGSPDCVRSAPVSLRAGQSGRTLTHGLASRLGADQ